MAYGLGVHWLVDKEGRQWFGHGGKPIRCGLAFGLTPPNSGDFIGM